MQRTLVSASPNLVEGRELNQAQGIAIDTTATPPILYVADTGNNRVLVWRDATAFRTASYADFVIGQRDLCSTLARADRDPDLAFGLYAPTSVAVDAAGQVYVTDAGNNRILRYPRPTFGTPAGAVCSARDPLLPNFVIGQSRFTDRSPNMGNANSTPGPNTIATVSSAPMSTSLVFDAAGNLYFTDAANHRVLRYPKASLADGQPNAPNADLVLGQGNFVSKTALSSVDATKPDFYAGLNQPAGLALDQSGRLFVSDAVSVWNGTLSRVLAFTPPFVSGGQARRYMGQRLADQPDSDDLYAHALNLPQGVFTIGDVPFVVDTYASRIVRYAPYPQWPDSATSLTPPIADVLGQVNLRGAQPNRGQALSGLNTLSTPTQAAVLPATGEIFVADAGNSRVLVFPNPSAGSLPGVSAYPDHILGQVNEYYSSANLIEGKEFGFSFRGAQGTMSQAGIAIDNSALPPRLYISDPVNNRVLGFKDARSVKPGDIADLIIGQPDGYLGIRNCPTNRADSPNAYGLNRPAGIIVDAAGNLYVADAGNGRVLRFPKPFAPDARTQNCVNGQCRVADLVLGQPGFTTATTGIVSSSLMAGPYGLALSKNGHLLVSDAVHNRVLMFLKPAGGDFRSGMSAASVFGQPDFASSGSGATDNRLNSPHGLAFDTEDRLYVSDSGNNRVAIFNNVETNLQPSDPLSVGKISTYNPYGVFVNKTTGEIWVAEAAAGRASRFAKYDNLTLCMPNCQATGQLPVDTTGAPQPLAVLQDDGGALYVADLAHRIATYYPGIASRNTASGAERWAPGTIVSIFVQQKLVDSVQAATTLPIPKTLADYQVTMNGVPAPIFAIAPVSFTGLQTQINCMIPMATPASGQVEFVVSRSNGEILGSYSFAMADAAPALFTLNQGGTGQAAALNHPDYSVNGPSNPIARGGYVMLFGTGQGYVAGAPPDGEAAAGAVNSEIPRVVVGTRFLDPADIVYSGLAPGLVGVWQVNIHIPEWVGIGTQPVAFQFHSVNSNVVTIAVK